MIASVTYHVVGNEPVVSGEKIVYFHPASGFEIIDILINGTSMNFADLTIDEQTGKVGTSETLAKGDWIECIYKTLPRFEIPTTPMVDFSEDDFSGDDFA